MRLLSEVGEGKGGKGGRGRGGKGERQRGRVMCPLEHLITRISLLRATGLSPPLGSQKEHKSF